MAAPIRSPSSAVSDASAASRFREAPWCFDIWQAAALLESLAQRNAEAACGEERTPFRFGVPARLGFPASEVQGVRWGGEPNAPEEQGEHAPPLPSDATPRLDVSILGLAGTDGPLPPPITVLVRERLRKGDTALQAFLDVFHNRLLRLWRENAVGLCPELDTDGGPDEQPFAAFLHAVAGAPSRGASCATPLAGPTPPCAGAVSSAVFRTCAAVWAQQPRSAAGLEKLVRAAFGVEARVEPFRGRWLELPEDARTRLGGGAGGNTVLGDKALLGGRVFDGAAGVTLMLGPLTPAQYRAFLPPPAGTRRGDLLALTRWYLGDAVACEVTLVRARNGQKNGTARNQ